MRLSLRFLRGQEVFARVVQSSALTASSYAITQALRLGSNLILTRLLFPEAFGLMALVSVFLVGLQMFSDVGLGPAIAQNKRGDDPLFLDTAWTIQIVRGVLLWICTCLLALPAAAFFDEPSLGYILPVAGLTLLIAGFNPTRIETAYRHLQIKRVIALDLTAQIIGMVCIVGLAWYMRSVWALVLGAIVGSMAKLVLMYIWLPGENNRLRWERSAGHDLIHFGKWIFFSTACGFLLAQGDKAILGKYLPLDALGIYNIGFFLASFPVLLVDMIVARVLIPLYREAPPAESVENYNRVRKMRFGLTGVALSGILLFAFSGVSLVNFLYDDRYAAAGAIVVVIASVQAIMVIGKTYDQAALAAGDSRVFFYLQLARAIIQTTLFLIGAEYGGLLGALAGLAIAYTLIHPMIIVIARRFGVWDPLHDLVYFLIGLSLGALAIWLHLDEVLTLALLSADG
ncbi:lipopolysaccharide biosynthesis protein [Tateyamaria omphalii]|uniref:oligosaccharide flippase family protein n=1 Tax=Tateyamaria omphalii TaxID=299262 RepID=UPI001678C41F|nr:oligosaccharide flippase family protein [Tateyamaria omphalii]GGX48691.1 lipopolysaccharide biosynthesis protein [Tateyamaria omphalii]